MTKKYKNNRKVNIGEELNISMDGEYKNSLYLSDNYGVIK